MRLDYFLWPRMPNSALSFTEGNPQELPLCENGSSMPCQKKAGLSAGGDLHIPCIEGMNYIFGLYILYVFRLEIEVSEWHSRYDKTASVCSISSKCHQLTPVRGRMKKRYWTAFGSWITFLSR